MTHVNGNSVSTVLEVSRKVYATSLVLYPNELRREFGAEMVEVFDEQVSEAYSRSGFPGQTCRAPGGPDRVRSPGAGASGL